MNKTSLVGMAAILLSACGVQNLPLMTIGAKLAPSVAPASAGTPTANQDVAAMHAATPVSQFVEQTMILLDRNHNGRISRAAHANDLPRTQRFLALADSQWTPGDPASDRNDGFVTRHELAKAIRDHVDVNHDEWVGPREREMARVNFGI